MYDIIIIGGGPAGICAAIYALRANKKVLILEKGVIGGKVATSPLIENYPGWQEIRGTELSEKLFEQVTNLGGEIQLKEVKSIQDNGVKKQVITEGEIYESYAVIIATGTKYKNLGLEEEDKFVGKGISYCAICDGFFYKNKIVAVIGGGNTAVANAIELSNVCKKVYVIQITDKLTAEPILIDTLEKRDNIEVQYKTKVKKLLGEETIHGLEIEQAGETKQIAVDGIFLAIGQIPETSIFQKDIQMSLDQYIPIQKNGSTNIEGIFAAGDCVEKEVRQLTTAVSDGTIAALSAVKYVDTILNR